VIIFSGQVFESFNQELGIITFTDVAKDDHITPMGNKLGIIDRFTRTFKSLVKKYTLENKTKKWIDKLNDIVELYNDTPHSGLKESTPNEVFEDYDYCLKLYEAQKKFNQKVDSKVPFKIGDKVRVLVQKKTFEKEKAPFSTDIYTIEYKVNFRYKLSGLNRLYRPSEMNLVTTVKDRIDVPKEDNQIRRMQRSKAFDSYDKLVEAIDKKDAPKVKRSVRKPKRYD
jgi:hypothetical protein